MNFEEQIMPRDKNPMIFLPQIEAIVSFKSFSQRAFLKIGEYSRIF